MVVLRTYVRSVPDSYTPTVLFIENRPAGSQSVKQSVNGRSFSRSFGQSVSGVTRHNYTVLKFNVINKKMAYSKRERKSRSPLSPLAK